MIEMDTDPRCTGAVRIVDLRVCDFVSPIGLDAEPEFSWSLIGNRSVAIPSHARVVVRQEVPSNSPSATRGCGLPSGTGAEHQPTAWDTGWQPLDAGALQNLPEMGLAPRTRYQWRVAVRGLGTSQDTWSSPAWWHTGQRDRGWQAKWISPSGWDDNDPVPRLVRSFLAPSEVQNAHLYVCGLGLSTFWLNGHRVGRREMDPPVSDYDKTVYYSTLDVSRLLRSGRNVLIAELARGWYSLRTRAVWNFHVAPWRAGPSMLAELWADGRPLVVSDEQWRWCSGPIQSDSVYGSHVVSSVSDEEDWLRLRDPQLLSHDFLGSPVAVTPGPRGRLTSYVGPAEEVTERLEPASSRATSNSRVFDFGRVISGWTELHRTGSAGKVTIRHGETIDDAGHVNSDQPHIDGPFQVDSWHIASSGRASLQARYGIKGFRYVEVESETEEHGREADDLQVTAQVVHSAVATTASVTSSSPVLDAIHRASVRSLLINLHGLPTDTPTFEQNGWLGDGHLTVETALVNFRDVGPLYRKWVQDLIDAQRPTGQIPVIAPTSGWGEEDAVEWAHAIVEVPWALYRYRGYRQVLEASYEAMALHLRWTIRAGTHAAPHSILGDWASPGHDELPPEGSDLTATAFAYRGMVLGARIASVLGRADDARQWTLRAGELREFFQSRFTSTYPDAVDTGTGGYRQTNQILPLAFGLVTGDQATRIAGRLIATIRTEVVHGTGVLGEKWLLPVLSKFGATDLAFDLLTGTEAPSWAHFLSQGDGTFWEHWHDQTRTRSHHMHASVDRWILEGLGGIRPSRPRYNRIMLAPHMPTQLSQLAVKIELPIGAVDVQWEVHDGQFELRVDLPAPTTLRLPANLARTKFPEAEEELPPGRHTIIGHVIGGEGLMDGQVDG